MLLGFWIAKILGAFAGGAFSLAFLVPATRKEALTRLGCGVFVGTVFGGVAIDIFEKQVGISVGTDIERAIAGAFLAAFISWHGLGLLSQLMLKFKPEDLKKGRK